MERNLRLYRGYQFARNLLFWFPVFFLYFRSIVPLREVLLLEAIYYAGVVVLEVPSGYASDLFGRRVVLVASAGFWAAAYAVFFAAQSFAGLAVAEVLLAAGMAFNSGSDSSLLYDTLLALGREAEYVRQEGLAQAGALAGTGGAALVAGFGAVVSLRVPYLLSLGGALMAFSFAWRLVEPPASRAGEGFFRQVAGAAALARRPVLRWCVAFVILMTIMDHVPYEFYQGYLDWLFPRHEMALPLSGGLVAAAMFLSSGASRLAGPLEERFGRTRTLLAAAGLQAGVIAAMGLFLHPVVLALVLCRDVPNALWTPILGGMVNERIDSSRRATFLSILSLAGRLGFSASLLVSAAAVERFHEAGWGGLRPLLLGYSGLALLGLVFLGLARPSGDEAS